MWVVAYTVGSCWRHPVRNQTFLWEAEGVLIISKNEGEKFKVFLSVLPKDFYLLPVICFLCENWLQSEAVDAQIPFNVFQASSRQ